MPDKISNPLILEPSYSYEEGATFHWDGTILHIEVAEEKAVDSYNESFTCQLRATQEQAIQLRDWLNSMFPEAA